MTAAASLVSGRFEILRELGTGGFGAVFEVLDRESGERMALKELRCMDAASIYRFKQEFRSLADISHENLVALHELHGAGERWFFTMELVDGSDFSAHVRPASASTNAETVVAVCGSNVPTVKEPYDAEPLPSPPSNRFEVDEALLRSALVQLVRGVTALHDAGKLHCDLKPSNVLVDRAGRLVILDFGLVTDTQAAGLSDQLQLAGTPLYMSPEHVRGARLSPASDGYSIGVMLFEALTGRPPYLGHSMTDILARKLIGDAPDPRGEASGVPDDLAELCVELTRLDPALRIDVSEVLARLESSGPARGTTSRPWARALEPQAMVGREPQLEMLHAAYQKLVTSGRATVVHVLGPSGMGKTMLLRRFLSDLRAEQAIVLEGRCYERESVPYNAFDSLIDELTHHLAGLSPDDVADLVTVDAHALARLFPVLENVGPIAKLTATTPSAPDPHQVRARAFRALRGLLGRLARRGRVVLAMDDLQWGDADSAALLEDLLRAPDPPPLLLIASYREEAAASSPLLSALCAPHGAVWKHEVALGPLAEADAGALAASLLGETRSGLSAELIARESGGSPLFVTELARYARLTATEAGGRSRRSDPGALTLEHVLGARVDDLPDAARRVLEIVATMGEPIAQRTALAAASVTSSQHDALAALRRADLLKRSAGSGGDRVEMFHDRIRDAVLGRLTPDERRDRHLQLAETLAASDRTDPEALARHFRAGGDALRAARYSVLAAERASAALAFDRAVALYRAALELARPDDRHDLQVKLADALVNAGRGADAARAYLGALSGADRRRAIDLRRRAAEHFLRSGHIDQGVATLRGVLSDVGLPMPGTPNRVLLSILGARLRLKLRGLSVRLREERDVAPDVLLRLDTCASASLGLSMVDVIRGADFQTRHLLLALDAGEPERLAVSLAINAMSAAARGGGRGSARAGALLGRARELATRIDQPFVDALIRASEGVSAFIGGRFGEARSELDQAERILGERCVGTDFHRTTVQLFSIAACFYLGEIRELDERVFRYLLEAEQRGDLYAEVNLRIAAGNMAWLSRDEPEEARRNATEALASWSRDGYLLQHWYALRSLAQIDLYEGRGADAYGRVSRDWRPLNRSFISRTQSIFIETCQLRGRAALAVADDPRFARALGEAEDAAKQLRGVGVAWSDCLALLLEGGMAAVRADRARAESLLKEAVERCESTNLRLHAAAARRRLGELVSGSRGSAELERGTGFMVSEGIRSPERFTRMLVPGFPARR